MDEPRRDDDELSPDAEWEDSFPPCGPATEWDTYTDAYGVTYICEKITGLRRGWFGLGPRRWGWRSLGRRDR